ncbi:MAG TPA: hypothetical protein VMB77_09300, partial [Syntrophales bacterium]|nr:hypothetical protein [Syntrophales bacterium]
RRERSLQVGIPRLQPVAGENLRALCLHLRAYRASHALAAYAAAGVAGSDPFKSGFRAFSLSLAKTFVPFAFIYAPIVLLMPWLLDPKVDFDWPWFIQCAFTLWLGVMAMGATVVGYFGGGRINYFERFLLAAATILLIIPGTTSDVIGMVILAGVFVKQVLKSRAGKKAAAP